MVKILLIVILAVMVFGWVGIGNAQERGIGVSPAKIEIEEGVEWPYTISLIVANLSKEKELFEISIDAEYTNFISISSGRFLLKGLEQRQIFLTFDKPRENSAGIIRISATRASENGFVTGTGIKVPFTIAGSGTAIPVATEEVFLAGAVNVIGEFDVRSFVIGLMVIFASIVALWYFSVFARRYFFSR